MKTFRGFLSVLAFGACLSVTMARAELISHYTFDNTTNNAVSGAADGTREGAGGSQNLPQYVTGALGGGTVGQALYFDNTDDSVNCTTDGLPEASYLWTGSTAFWVKNSQTSATSIWRNEQADGTFADVQIKSGYLQLDIEGATATPGTLRARQVITGTGAPYKTNTGVWCHVVLTWNATTGNSGTGNVAMYVDGVSQGVTYNVNSVTSSTVFSDWENPMRIGNVALGTTPATKFTGSLDDMAVWSSRLTATEAFSLYNLAADAELGYGASSVQALFDIFGGGVGTRNSVGGKTWAYATGLVGNPGTVVNDHTALVLDALGNGVQIVPEPSTFALLVMAGLALVAYGWRKQK